jgi:hypothetical protein
LEKLKSRLAAAMKNHLTIVLKLNESLPHKNKSLPH